MISKTLSQSSTINFSLALAYRSSRYWIHIISNILSPLPFRRMNLWSSSLRERAVTVRVRGGQSSFRSFLLNPSRRTIGLEGNQKDETPSFANPSCVLRAFIVRVSKGAVLLALLSFWYSDFSAQPLEAEKYTGVEKSEQERQRTKQIGTSPDLGSGFDNTSSWDVARHTCPL